MSGFARHSVSLEQLEWFMRDMATFDARAEARLQDLDAQMERLHESWTGEAADSQRAAHDQLREGLATMRRGLADLRAGVATARANYQSAVDANVRMFEGLG